MERRIFNLAFVSRTASSRDFVGLVETLYENVLNAVFNTGWHFVFDIIARESRPVDINCALFELLLASLRLTDTERPCALNELILFKRNQVYFSSVSRLAPFFAAMWNGGGEKARLCAEKEKRFIPPMLFLSWISNTKTSFCILP